MIAAKRFRREPRAWNWGLARQRITRTKLMITSPAICGSSGPPLMIEKIRPS